MKAETEWRALETWLTNQSRRI